MRKNWKKANELSLKGMNNKKRYVVYTYPYMELLNYIQYIFLI